MFVTKYRYGFETLLLQRQTTHFRTNQASTHVTKNNSYDIMCSAIFDPSQGECVDKVTDALEELEKYNRNKKKEKKKARPPYLIRRSPQ